MADGVNTRGFYPDTADLENMKHVKGKIDQAEIEVNTVKVFIGMFSFPECEHWNIDVEIKKIAEHEQVDIGVLPEAPDIRIFRS